MFSQDFKELLSAFNAHRVKYLIDGGYALAVHAQPRATKDLDLFVESGRRFPQYEGHVPRAGGVAFG
jgi:hypothetical protein